MILPVECSLLKCPLTTRLVVVGFEVHLVRFGLTTEHAAHTASIKLQCYGAMQGADPLLNGEM